MNKLTRKLKSVGIDILGVLMIIGAILFGWLPGPGGIPLFLGGLTLLSINHEWAKRLLERVKKDGQSIIQMIFRDHPYIKLLFDVVSILLVSGAVYLLYHTDRTLLESVAIVMFFMGLGLFLGNRKRLERIISKIKRKT